MGVGKDVDTQSGNEWECKHPVGRQCYREAYYKIYEYHHEKNESFRIIYPDDKLEEIKNSNINHNVDFKFISIPCSLLEVPVEEFSKFSENEWNNFKSAVIIASNGKDNDKNKRNIEIKW